jgi:cytidylate kinase
MSDVRFGLVQPAGSLLANKPTVAIVISGPSRTGKTSAANILADRYDIPNIKIGEEFRRRTGIDTSRFVNRDPVIDKEMDDLQLEWIRSATPTTPFILEGRLAAFLASQERARTPLPLVTILFWAPEDVRMERQLRKVLRDEPESTVSLDELLAGEREREARDLALWKLVHPELDDKNPFDPGLTDPTGALAYDLVVDTRMGMPDACAEYVHGWLLERGLISTLPVAVDETG